MRAIILGVSLAASAYAAVASHHTQPSAPLPGPPCVAIDFSRVPIQQLHYSNFRVVILTTNRAFPVQVAYSTVESLGSLTRGSFADDLERRRYRVDVSGDNTVVRIFGYDAAPDDYHPVVGAVLSTQGLKSHERPRLTNPPPTPVKFNFWKLPNPLPAAETITLGVSRPDGSKAAVEVRAPAGATPADIADVAVKDFGTAGVRTTMSKAGVVEVVGWSGPGGKVVPALGGTVTAVNLKAGQLPNVTGPPAPLPRAVIDLSQLPVEPGTVVAVRVKATAVGGAAFDRVIRAGGRAALVRAIEAELVDEDFQAWAEGDRVMLYGWATRSARLLTITGAWVTADDLVAGARPRVELQGDIPLPTAPPPRPTP